MSLFGTTPKPGGLFGTSTTAQQPQQTGGLFGSSTLQQTQTAPAAGGGLFAASTTQPQQQQQTSSLFGSSTAQKPALSLFGSTTQQQPAQNTATGGGGLFGISAAPAAQSQQEKLAQSFLSGSTSVTPLPRLGESQWMTQPNPREKPIRDQMLELFQKWHPASPNSLFTYYFYTSVGADRAPYYGVPPDEDSVKWEEALKHKPAEGCIPVLARGFGDEGIAGRVKLQQLALAALTERMHEIDKSLTTRIEEHDLKFTVRAQEARRRHIALSRRCLALATKVQVLRNRGYALDAAEEELKDRLFKLEKQVFDPVLNGRQEELWARMTVVRERARILKVETERLGKKAGELEGAEQIDEETMAKIRQILMSYDSQLGHLRRELDLINKEFESWEASEKLVNGPKR
ncbi:hypothetical protein, variant 5 [Verruconis gallopava]|uniref:Nucleoporin Nup54 alpha-helical domain-containing protein n=1 Tax=Verruconis gallopava TaxID=253628 RepID=A0A0D1XA78_9PEZI|nr:uncharacterized protein PV09_09228 [Verruconis gallopava]XP_016208927.1 hypothetical protein, variant 1 [Verruconis gallopava]XP_016208928.1 hypothetical protein, variant 2 [Verruconis gallopava]XP_016208929.1 hypothetical protein, variant 3 [Verruconis gallopava]XP_016208930.1 hypothetical protein, variant 4 [Verruconis gallopava]XP_016208931.1 hypothetical protein, variant 5 [Verruconis gallopava]KIV99056.1 hypothetical protein PV09_09228 [Verruconis gallopava]KIV99057.1 hypothetical pr